MGREPRLPAMVPRDKEAKKAEASVYERIRQMIRWKTAHRGDGEQIPAQVQGSGVNRQQ